MCTKQLEYSPDVYCLMGTTNESLKMPTFEKDSTLTSKYYLALLYNNEMSRIFILKENEHQSTFTHAMGCITGS